jgi:formylglycine-generating enzyme required for sulfatase activity
MVRLDDPAGKLKPFYLDDAEFADASGIPITKVTYAEAEQTCAAQTPAKRLPTEAEWSLAAGMGTLDPKNAAFKSKDRKGPAPVRSHAGDVTSAGVYDMLGNVMEWTATDWPDKAGHKTVRGGSVAFAANAGKLSSIHARAGQPASKGDDVIGFRCALDAPEEPEGAEE